MNTLQVRLFFIAFSLCLTIGLQAQLLEELPRHAYWGASFGSPANSQAGVSVVSVVPGAFAQQTDLRPGDILLKVNGILINSVQKKEEVLNTTAFIKGGMAVTLDILRKGSLIQKKGVVPARPKENFKGIVTEYRSVLSPQGYKVQVIITRPEGAKGKLPGIFVVRWMSCDPIEKPVGRKHGVARMLEDFVMRSGYAVMRVEKAGLGDSEGPPCYDMDFSSELAVHREAYKAFKKLDFVDSNKLVVFAQSNGAAYAPAVPDRSPAAYVISGGWTKTWFEHMLEFKRRNYQLDGLAPEEVNRKMNLEAEFYTDYLIRKKNPVDILNQKSYLNEVWSDEPDHQWGLPAAYFQQLQEFNVARAWKKVGVPTYIFYGEYDFAMLEEDHQQIVEWVNSNGAGLAQYELVPKMEHSLFWFDNAKATSNFYGNGTYKEELATRLMNWMKGVVK